MNEWTVVTVIVTLIGLVVAVVKPLISLNTTITKLAAVVDELDRSVAALTQKNGQAHDRIWTKLSEHGELLGEHETRLAVIEKGGR